MVGLFNKSFIEDYVFKVYNTEILLTEKPFIYKDDTSLKEIENSCSYLVNTIKSRENNEIGDGKGFLYLIEDDNINSYYKYKVFRIESINSFKEYLVIIRITYIEV